MLKLKLFVITLLLFFTHLQAQQFIPLWPDGKKPNSNGKKITDSIFNERIISIFINGYQDITYNFYLLELV